MSRQIKDLESFERKVRPIYDALDSRNWKVGCLRRRGSSRVLAVLPFALHALHRCLPQGALKLCQQALQKYPENELIKVLKAIGLDRSGKREEANQVQQGNPGIGLCGRITDS